MDRIQRQVWPADSARKVHCTRWSRNWTSRWTRAAQALRPRPGRRSFSHRRRLASELKRGPGVRHAMVIRIPAIQVCANWTKPALGRGRNYMRPAATRRHPAFEQLSSTLRSLPEFTALAEQISILSTPQQFYETLLRHIASAKRRIFIASLYIGKDELKLIGALHNALNSEPQLKLTILVDYLRSTRELPSASSASVLGSLAASFPDRVELRLYHTPNLAGWTKQVVPRRFDEGWGLQHLKCYGFDDTVIMSGANLSHDYFTNRQDRYIEFSSHSALADYFHSLIDTISSFSFAVSASDTATQHPRINITWPPSNRLPNFLDHSAAVKHVKFVATERIENLTLDWARDPTARSSGDGKATTPIDSYETTVRPVLQMGTFGIAQETGLVVPSIFQIANSIASAPGGSATTIDWTSGYFSVNDRYKSLFLQSQADLRIVAASPEANGFYESRGISKYLPPAYTYLQHQFFLQAQGQARRKQRPTHIEFREWKRSGWTYHAKGIWLTPTVASSERFPPNHSSRSDYNDLDDWLRHTHPEPPWLTLIGSSNYGRRSASRDLEASVLITTTSPHLRRELGKELKNIRAFATDVVDDALFERAGRRVPWGVKIAAKAIEDML